MQKSKKIALDINTMKRVFLNELFETYFSCSIELIIMSQSFETKLE